MDPASRDEAFRRIKQYFQDADRERYRQGKMPLGSTEKGFWGTAHLDDVYEWCTRIGLDGKDTFIDLGSGDGRVVLVAGLFTHATGIEYDEALHELAEKARSELGVADATFIKGDYTQHDLSAYDVWFSYADHGFEWLRGKRHEMKPGIALHLYHDTYHPDFLVKGKITWIGQIPIFTYTNEEKPPRKPRSS